MAADPRGECQFSGCARNWEVEFIAEIRQYWWRSTVVRKLESAREVAGLSPSSGSRYFCFPPPHFSALLLSIREVSLSSPSDESKTRGSRCYRRPQDVTVIEVRAANHPAASANQNVAMTIPREKLHEWLPCFLYKLMQSNRAKDWLIFFFKIFLKLQ